MSRKLYLSLCAIVMAVLAVASCGVERASAADRPPNRSPSPEPPKRRANPELAAAAAAHQFRLLKERGVQKDLGMSNEQVRKVSETEAGWKTQDGFELGNRALGGAKTYDQIADRYESGLTLILDMGQRERVQQISWQLRHPEAFRDAKVAEALGLTGEQSGEVRETWKDVETAAEESAAAEGTKFAGAKRKAADAVRRKAEQKLKKLLDADQKARWDELVGKPFRGKVSVPKP